MALSLATMLSEFGRYCGLLRHAGTTTALGNTVTAVDSGLTNVADTDGQLKDVWLLLTSGDYGTLALGKKILNAYTATSGTMGWAGALAGNSGSGNTYLLFDCDPQYLVDALNDARKRAIKRLWRNIVDDGMVTDSWVFNGGMVHWDGGLPVGWVKSNASLTVSHIAAAPTGHGVRLTGGAYQLRASLDFAPDYMALTDLASTQDITIVADILTAVVAQAAVGLSVNGSASLSSLHTGGNAWEQRSKLVTVAKDYRGLYAILDIAATGNADFANIYTTGGPQRRSYPVPSTFIKEPSRIEICDSSDLTRKVEDFSWSEVGRADWNFHEASDLINQAASTTPNTIGRVEFDYRQPAAHRMRWYGKALLSEVTVLTDVMQVDNRTSSYLYAWAMHLLGGRLQREPQNQAQQEHGKLLEEQGFRDVQAIEAMGDNLSRSPRQSSPPLRF